MLINFYLGMKFYAFLTIYSLSIQGKDQFTPDGNGLGQHTLKHCK